MRTFTTEHEARKAVEDVMKRYPDATIEEIHIDSRTDHNWYILIHYNGRTLWKCKWSSPIIKFR
jgi:hypothetical protein